MNKFIGLKLKNRMEIILISPQLIKMEKKAIKDTKLMKQIYSL